MTDHQFTYPRVMPVVLAEEATERGRPAADRARRLPRSQRELVAASLVRCPPRDGARTARKGNRGGRA